jgi:NADPH2:quinone reductase
MQAIVVRTFGGPDVLRLEEVAEPTAGPGQVLVRVKAIGVNPVDTYIRAGTYTRLPDLPFSPGSDAAGIVEAVGDGVTSCRPGDRVYLLGTAGSFLVGAYAEKVVCEPDHVYPLAARVSFAQGAAVGVPYATAYRALFQRAGARAGETVLVHGASGGVGVAATQMAVARGMTTIGTAGSAKGLELVEAQGATHVLDHRQESHYDEIVALTGGRGVDVIVEMAAHLNLAKDLPTLAPKGRVVIVGSRGAIEITPRDTRARDAAILGMALWTATAGELASIHAGLVAGLSNGTLRPVVGRQLPLADAARAHEAVLEAGALGKIVLTV